MIILFDTRDLINLLESENPCTVEECDSILRLNGGSVVITLTHLREIAAPLELAGPGPPVTATLNKLEVLPLTYAEEVTLPPRELAEAINAFRAGREPRVIDPYVERLDAAVPFPVPTRGFVNYPLAEIVWEIWHHNPDTFRRQPRMGGMLRKAVEDRRSRGQAGGDLTEFSTLLPDLAATWGLSLACLNVADLARWLWQRSRRCPGILLWFWVRHQIMRNTTDKIKNSDIADLSWTWLLPYVTHATLDRRMKHYVQTVIRQNDDEGCAQIHPSAAELLQTLKRRTASNQSPNTPLERTAKTLPLSS